MDSGGEVRFRRKLALSVLAATFLAGWVVAPTSALAFIQQDLRISQNGTVYQLLCNRSEERRVGKECRL